MASPKAAMQLTRLLVAALRRLGEAGEPAAASRLAAEAYAEPRQAEPHLAERINGAMHYLARLEAAAPNPERSPMMKQDPTLDVRSEPPARRHALIFERFNALEVGEAFVLVNDHDPKPLYYQLSAEQGGTFSWEYLEPGPEMWRVRIGRTAPAGEAPKASRTDVTTVSSPEATS